MADPKAPEPENNEYAREIAAGKSSEEAYDAKHGKYAEPPMPGTNAGPQPRDKEPFSGFRKGK